MVVIAANTILIGAGAAVAAALIFASICVCVCMKRILRKRRERAAEDRANARAARLGTSGHHKTGFGETQAQTGTNVALMAGRGGTPPFSPPEQVVSASASRRGSHVQVQDVRLSQR